MEIMGHDLNEILAAILVVVTLVTPAARALMFASKQLGKVAALTQNKTDDAIVAKVVYGLESICGTLAKVAMHMPRMTVGK